MNEIFPIPNSLSLNDGFTTPMIVDPLNLGQEKGIYPINSTTAPVGYPSIDLLIDTYKSLTSFGEQPDTVVQSLLSKEPNLIGTSTTNFDPLTGSSENEPLVGSLSKNEVTSSLPFIPLSASDIEGNKTQPFADFDISTMSAPRQINDQTPNNQLTDTILEVFRTEAIASWIALGLTEINLDLLKNVQLVIANLPGYALGSTLGQVITIDTDAAGRGWFIDSSPADDSEFSNIISSGQLQATEKDAGFGYVDLLTVVTHEIGHVLGLQHIDSNQIMSATLPIGTRFLPLQEDLNFTQEKESYQETAQLNTLALPTISAASSSVTGSLSPGDAYNSIRPGSYKDDYQLTNFTVGQPIKLNLTSSNFNTVLELINADTLQKISNISSYSSSRGSQLTFVPESGIDYIVRVTSYYYYEQGTYTLEAKPGYFTSFSDLPTISADSGTVNDSLSETDADNPNRLGSYSDDYRLTDYTVGQPVRLNLSSQDLRIDKWDNKCSRENQKRIGDR